MRSKWEKFAWRQGHCHVFNNSITRTRGEEMSGCVEIGDSLSHMGSTYIHATK